MQMRYVMSFMGFTTILVSYGMRICLSITITVMTKPIESEEAGDETCHPNQLSTSHLIDNGIFDEDYLQSGVYEWDEYLQGIILSSFYCGYVFTVIPGGMIAEFYGSKQMVGLGLLLTALMCLITPITVHLFGAVGLIIVRVLMGLAGGLILPGLAVLVMCWIPTDERTRVAAIMQGGVPMGMVFTTILAGVILKHHEWDVVFYVFGALGSIWYLAWRKFIYNSPNEHPYISQSELNYLTQSIIPLDQRPPVPWSRLLKSMPLWALVAAQVGHDWGFYTVITDLPKYMASVLHLRIEENGFLSSLPFIGMWVSISIATWGIECLITRNVLPNDCSRKIGTTVTAVGPGVFLLAAVYAGCERTLVVSLFVLGVMMLESGIPLEINALGLSPKYASSIMAIMNCFATCSGIITPYIVGLLTPHQTLTEWRHVFWIVLGVLLITNAIYIIFGSGQLEEGSEREQDDRQEEREDRDERSHQTESIISSKVINYPSTREERSTESEASII